MEIIKIDAKDYNYISEFLDDLPDNSFVNKQLTGVGSTTCVLQNKIPYVICVPYISLIKNKLKSNNNCFGFYGGIKLSELDNYLSNIEIPKILVTFDSLKKLVEHINPKEFKILIDEAHKLLDSASFRYKAVESVIRNYEKFKSFCFVTATPIKDKYQLPELIDIQKYEIEWNDVETVNIHWTKYENCLNDHIRLIILDYLEGKLSGTPFFFINSVTSIIEIIRKIQASNTQYDNADYFKIMCADNDHNNSLLKYKLGSDYKVDNTTTPNKQINFLTSTNFEGSDIFQEDGITYIVTDGKKDYTKYDISTTIFQIIGRIRNSKYKNDVYFLYSENQYLSYTSITEFEKDCREELKLAEDYTEKFKVESNPKVKKALFTQSLTDKYLIDTDEGDLEPNTWVIQNELFNYEILHTTYKVKFRDRKINNVPYQFKEFERNTELRTIDKVRLRNKVDFRDVCKEYIDAIENNDVFVKNVIEKDFELIKIAVKELGIKKIKALKYQKKNLEQALLLKDNKPNEQKVIKLLNLRIGQCLPRSELKNRIQQVYNELNIKSTAKATDIKQWYNIQEYSKRTDTGVLHMIKIINCNIK